MLHLSWTARVTRGLSVHHEARINTLSSVWAHPPTSLHFPSFSPLPSCKSPSYGFVPARPVLMKQYSEQRCLHLMIRRMITKCAKQPVKPAVQFHIGVFSVVPTSACNILEKRWHASGKTWKHCPLVQRSDICEFILKISASGLSALTHRLSQKGFKWTQFYYRQK